MEKLQHRSLAVPACLQLLHSHDDALYYPTITSFPSLQIQVIDAPLYLPYLTKASGDEYHRRRSYQQGITT